MLIMYTIRGTIVFIPPSPGKDPILVGFNIKNELTTMTRDTGNLQ